MTATATTHHAHTTDREIAMSISDKELANLYDELIEQTQLVQHTRQLLTNLAAQRREVTRKLADSGQSYRQIADRLGVSKSAIQQILS